MVGALSWLVAALSVAASHVHATGLIGACDKTLVSNIMYNNSANCPVDVLKKILAVNPLVVFRVFPQAMTEKNKCVLGVLKDVDNNAMDLDVTIYPKDGQVLAVTPY